MRLKKSRKGFSILCCFHCCSLVCAMAASERGFNWKKYERPGLTQDEIEEIKEAFDLFDVDGTQRINPRDLRTAIQALNLKRNTVVISMLNEIERQGAKPLDFDGFLDL